MMHLRFFAPGLRAICLLLLGLPCAHARAQAVPDDGVPAGFVSFFDRDGCPPGWEEVPRARGRALLFAATPERVGTTVGEPVPARTSPRHRHPELSAVFSAGKSYFTGADGCINSEPFASGDHVAGGATDETESGLPFVHQPLCKKTEATKDDVLPFATYAFFDAQSCPEAWEPITECDTCPEVAGRLVVPLAEGARLGRVVGQPWLDARHGRVHVHRVMGKLVPADAGLLALTGSNHRGARGAMPFDGRTGMMSSPHHGIPYVEFLGCLKSAFSPGGPTPPPGLTIFYGGEASCPIEEGWHTTARTAGRLLIASPEAGLAGVHFGGSALTDGEERWHRHPFHGTLHLRPARVCLNGGGLHIGRSGSYPFSGTTDPAPLSVPYVQLRQCTYRP